MKILVLSFLLICQASSFYSQNFKELFLFNDFINYKGSLLKINSANTSANYHFSFYDTIENCYSENDSSVIYPMITNIGKTNKDSLLDRVFLVSDIIDCKGRSYIMGISSGTPIFVLVDTLNFKVIYYKYDKEFEFGFPFLVQLDIDSKELCSNIEYEKDDFDGVVRENSPILTDYKVNKLVITKVTRDKKANYYLSLRAYGSTLNVGEKGAIILFSDGTKLEKQLADIDVNVSDIDLSNIQYEYSAYIPINSKELELLANKRIKKFRLYIYDSKVGVWYGEKFSYYIKCLK
ncbi:MAG: hypothetical protein ACK5UE_14945 [Chitinophagales bacterium]|nr:hypothetical protein [Sphingobacteriales bacterium]